MVRGVRNGVVAVLFALAFVGGPVVVGHAQAEVTFVAQHGADEHGRQGADEHESGDDDQGYWGLLGLIGLVGLVGLVRRGRRGDLLAGPADAPPATRTEL
jgi:MYXO-CTERM domain-containing protein